MPGRRVAATGAQSPPPKQRRTRWRDDAAPRPDCVHVRDDELRRSRRSCRRSARANDMEMMALTSREGHEKTKWPRSHEIHEESHLYSGCLLRELRVFVAKGCVE